MLRNLMHRLLAPWTRPAKQPVSTVPLYSDLIAVSCNSSTSSDVLHQTACLLLEEKERVQRQRSPTLLLAEWAWNCICIARNPATSVETLLLLANSQTHWCERAVADNPRASAAVLLCLIQSEWRDVRETAWNRLCLEYPLYCKHHAEVMLDHVQHGENLERLRQEYQDSIRPVWQPALFAEMYSQRNWYSKKKGN